MNMDMGWKEFIIVILLILVAFILAIKQVQIEIILAFITVLSNCLTYYLGYKYGKSQNGKK